MMVDQHGKVPYETYRAINESIFQQMINSLHKVGLDEDVALVRARLSDSDRLKAEWDEQVAAICTIIDYHIYKTRITAVENSRTAYANDVFADYRQDFTVRERPGKLIYNTMRAIRDRPRIWQGMSLMMIEPDSTLTKPVDAWVLNDISVGHIRNSATPARMLAEASTEPTKTTFELRGNLDHSYSILDRAAKVMDRLAAQSFKIPYPESSI